MHQHALALLFTSLSLLTGCVVSALHPIYSLTCEWKPQLSKEAETSNVSWSFSKPIEPDAYTLTHTDYDGKQGEFSAHLRQIEGEMFLDLFPGEHESLGINVLYAFHFVLAHTFVLCQQEQSKWDLRFMNLGWLKKHWKAVPDAIAHEVMTVNKENQIVITAGTHELQKFVVKHVNTLGAYGKPLHQGDFFQTRGPDTLAIRGQKISPSSSWSVRPCARS